MPTREAIVNTLIPKEIEKPIPTRMVSTRVAPLKPSGDQTTIVEKAQVAESTPPAESVKLSPQLSALARKEQAFRQREQAFKEREKTLEAKLADAEQYSQLKAKLGSKDYSEAEKLGLTYEGYTEYLLSKQNSEDPQGKELKSLKDEVDALKKRTEEDATKEYEETVAEYKKEIAALISSNPDYSSVKELKREDAVLQLILDSWEEDGEEVSIEQAAKDIEEALVEDATKMAALPKLKPKVEEPVKLPPPKPGLKTLTNQVTVSSEKKPAKSLQYMTESERYAEARRRVLERKQGQ